MSAASGFTIFVVALVALSVIVDALPARTNQAGVAGSTRRGTQTVGGQKGKGRMTTTMATLAGNALTGNSTFVAPTDDANTMSTLLSHCPVLCSPGKKRHPLGHLVPRYNTYGVCMDECICAAYCYLLDMAGELEYEECFVACSEAAPFSSDGELVKAVAQGQQ